MLLQKLREFQARVPEDADDTEAPPPEYKAQAIPWILRLDAKGRADMIRTSGRVARSGRDAGKEFAAPFLRRSGTRIKPQVLADKAEFVLGVAETSIDRAAARHAEFVALVDACAKRTGIADVGAVLDFLEGLPASGPPLPEDLAAGDFMTFEVDGRRPIDRPEVRQFWASVAPRLRQKGLPALDVRLVESWLADASSDESGRCIVCGKEAPIARIHPVPIRLPRSVSDQQVSVVSANKDAFWSYGLEQSHVAPTCTPCAESYGRALNRLARSDANSIVIGSSVFVFWTREHREFDLKTILTDPQPENVRELIDGLRLGRSSGAPLDDTQFYGTSLSASGGRAVVRDWIDTTVGQVQTHVAKWFERQHIVSAWGEVELRPLGLYALAAATVRDPRRDLSESYGRVIVAQLLRGALRGTQLPSLLLHRAVQRNRAEQSVTRPRAALIKLVLTGNEPLSKEEHMVQLDPDSPSLGYRCGRLMAVLEQAQRLAIPGINSTIVDRFFATASTSPASVLPRLVRGAQPHLAKLDRDRKGAFIALQRRLEEIQAEIPATGYPRILNLQEQGLFALGYYHQRAYDRAQAMEAKNAKEQQKNSEAELLPDDDASEKEEE